MSAFAKVGGWAKEHPVEAGIAVFAVGLVVLYALGAFKPASASSSGTQANGSSSALDSAYLAATSATASASAAQNIALIQANAATAQAQISSNTTLGVNNTWATQQYNTTLANNQQELNLGALQLDQQLNNTSLANGDNQFLLNLNEYGNPQEFGALVNSGYFTTH